MLADVIHAGGGVKNKNASAKLMRPDAPLDCTENEFCLCEVCSFWGPIMSASVGAKRVAPSIAEIQAKVKAMAEARKKIKAVTGGVNTTDT
jgi:hypothetical protein